MKTMMMVITLLGFVGFANANETVAEKTTAVAKDAKRGMKKGANRVKEAACGKLTGDSKVECLAKKAGHRVEETAAAVGDGVTEKKNEMDTDKK